VRAASVEQVEDVGELHARTYGLRSLRRSLRIKDALQAAQVTSQTLASRRYTCVCVCVCVCADIIVCVRGCLRIYVDIEFGPTCTAGTGSTRNVQFLPYFVWMKFLTSVT